MTLRAHWRLGKTAQLLLGGSEFSRRDGAVVDGWQLLNGRQHISETLIHIIVTVGESELPIVVAVSRIVQHCCSKGPVPLSVNALCTPETADEWERSRNLLLKRSQVSGLAKRSEACQWRSLVVSDTAPEGIQMMVHQIIRNEPDCCEFHLHFTGGSRVLSVLTMEALTGFRYEDGSGCRLQYSYMRPGEELLFPVSAFDQPTTDERCAWTLSINDVAALNRFTTEFYSLAQRQFVRPRIPTAEETLVGSQVSNILIAGRCMDGYSIWLRDRWDRVWNEGSQSGREWRRWPSPPPKHLWPTERIAWFAGDISRDWASVTHRIACLYGRERAWRQSEEGWELDVQCLEPNTLSRLHRFLHHEFFELLVYGCVKTRLLSALVGRYYRPSTSAETSLSLVSARQA